MKKIAVCGGAGQVGNHLVARLKRQGHYVVVFDRKYPEWKEAMLGDQYNIFDLRNDLSYFSVFRWQEFDEVYQLAAEMGGAEFVFTGEHDAEIMHNSARINLNVLEACREAKVKKVLFTSSARVYPSLLILPYNDTRNYYVDKNSACREDMAGNPDSPYGLEKLFAESLYDSYRRAYGIETRIARLHNVYGCYGTWFGGREKAPAAFMRKIAEVGEGGTIDCFGSGEQTRSFIHGPEAAEGLIRLMDSDCHEPLNIGSSEMVTINQMISMIADIAGKTVKINHIEGPLGVRGRNSDNAKIFEKLGWKPTKTLKEGLMAVYPWIRDQALHRQKVLAERAAAG